MKQVTINIPEGKLDFFIELFQSLGLTFSGEENHTIPNWQQEIVSARMKEIQENPSKSIDFDLMIDRIEKKYGL